MKMSSESLGGDNGGANKPSMAGRDPRSSKPWKYLTRFELTCQGRNKVRCPVYANGRQQIPVEIIIEARDEDGVVVDIPTDYASLKLRLCEYNDTESYPHRIGEAHFEDEDYVYDWQAQRSSDAPENGGATSGDATLPNSVQVVRRWLYTDVVHSRKLAVRCTSPDGVVFATNTPNPPDGKFDSYIIVEGRAPQAIPWDKVSLTKINALNDIAYDVDLYYVYFTDPNIRIVGTNHNPDFGGADYKHYGWRQGDSYREQVCFGRSGGARMVTWQSHPEIRSCQFMVNDRPGQATLARVLLHLGYFVQKYRRYGVYLGLIDQFGNESRVGIHPIKDVNEIQLVDPNTKALDHPPEPELSGSVPNP
jgi:hypothetical protein